MRAKATLILLLLSLAGIAVLDFPTPAGSEGEKTFSVQKVWDRVYDTGPASVIFDRLAMDEEHVYGIDLYPSSAYIVSYYRNGSLINFTRISSLEAHICAGNSGVLVVNMPVVGINYSHFAILYTPELSVIGEWGLDVMDVFDLTFNGSAFYILGVNWTSSELLVISLSPDTGPVTLFSIPISSVSEAKIASFEGEILVLYRDEETVLRAFSEDGTELWNLSLGYLSSISLAASEYGYIAVAGLEYGYTDFNVSLIADGTIINSKIVSLGEETEIFAHDHGFFVASRGPPIVKSYTYNLTEEWTYAIAYEKALGMASRGGELAICLKINATHSLTKIIDSYGNEVARISQRPDRYGSDGVTAFSSFGDGYLLSLAEPTSDVDAYNIPANLLVLDAEGGVKGKFLLNGSVTDIETSGGKAYLASGQLLEFDGNSLRLLPGYGQDNPAVLAAGYGDSVYVLTLKGDFVSIGGERINSSFSHILEDFVFPSDMEVDDTGVYLLGTSYGYTSRIVKTDYQGDMRWVTTLNGTYTKMVLAGEYIYLLGIEAENISLAYETYTLSTYIVKLTSVSGRIVWKKKIAYFGIPAELSLHGDLLFAHVFTTSIFVSMEKFTSEIFVINASDGSELKEIPLNNTLTSDYAGSVTYSPVYSPSVIATNDTITVATMEYDPSSGGYDALVVKLSYRIVAPTAPERTMISELPMEIVFIAIAGAIGILIIVLVIRKLRR